MLYIYFEKTEDLLIFSQLSNEQIGKIIRKLIVPSADIILTSKEEIIYNKLQKTNNNINERNKLKVLKSWETRKKKEKEIITKTEKSIEVKQPIRFQQQYYSKSSVIKNNESYKKGECKGVLHL